ncbi:MAG: S41 family peptidase [Cytophagales bacterium]|nr:MAG: S41 family peptidase [Cytophagales bacterium]
MHTSLRNLTRQLFIGLMTIWLLTIPAIAQNKEFSKNNQANTEYDKYFEIAKNIDIFTTLFKELNAYYVDEVNPNKLMQEGIDAMLKSLDPYTNYIPEDEIEEYRTMTTGQYGGIGVTVLNREGTTIVAMPYVGSPAHQAGLKVGDEIVKVDDIILQGKNTEEVSKLLKGQAGTKVKLMVKRYGQSELLPYELVRQNIKIDNVPYYGMIGTDVGYLQLSDFTSNASLEVKNAVEKLKASGATKIILDLRGNPGGLLNEAVNICNLFIPRESEVVTTKAKIEEWNKVYRAYNPPLDLETPMVVLINGRSASAAEIVSGVLQDYDRAVLIGEKSFGKGLVQSTRPISYNSQVKITIAKYYIPSGRCIQAIDYSQKDENGKPIKMPDSLRRAFKTQNGRVVYDGEGLMPDIVIPKSAASAILNSLESKNLLFDYAIVYRQENANFNEQAEAFHVSEEAYQKFVKWLSEKDYDYTTEAEKALVELEKKAKEEKYFEAIQAELVSLKNRLSHSKEADLQTFKKEIIAALEKEIIAHYYLEKGVTQLSLRDDEDIKAALELFKDQKRYNEILKK